MKERIKSVKVCIICKEPFIPDPRVGDRQKVCNNLYCKRERKRISQKKWLSQNPDYFKGRYTYLKEQILENQRKRRNRHPSINITQNDIQDKLTSSNNKALPLLNKTLTIQDELCSLITKVKRCLVNTQKLIYKTS